jgi:hypothetical protein
VPGCSTSELDSTVFDSREQGEALIHPDLCTPNRISIRKKSFTVALIRSVHDQISRSGFGPVPKDLAEGLSSAKNFAKLCAKLCAEGAPKTTSDSFLLR